MQSAFARNPFEFGAANDLGLDQIIEYYIEDYNYSRFIQSKRNVLLLGERGSGKTMTLLYNSFESRRRKAELDNEDFSLEKIGVYIPCNNPIAHRREYELLESFKASVVSEHFLVLAVAYWIASTVSHGADFCEAAETEEMANRLELIIGHELPAGSNIFERVKLFAEVELQRTQSAINAPDSDSFYPGALTFSTLVSPLLNLIKQVNCFRDTHFLLMFDDVHDLNEYQIATLNSWVAYRDHSTFSFKLATAKVSRPSLVTASGGSILEGHDFTAIDMEEPLHNPLSSFGHLARRITEKRLRRVGIQASPEKFFPIHSELQNDLQEFSRAARMRAEKRYGPSESKKISDYVYKYHRADYFRQRSQSKANRPIYSGFDTITYLSTGVIRNLLEPCYWMYDRALSDLSEEDVESLGIEEISPTVQNEIIKKQSADLWKRIEDGLDNMIAGCTSADAEQVRNLFEALARMFRDRLLANGSEPRASSFTISGRERADMQHLGRLLYFAQKALLLYTRSGPAKDHGARETYYVLNRMLLPARGLDPHGQHARVSLKAGDLLGSAIQGGRLAGDESAADQMEMTFDE